MEKKLLKDSFELHILVRAELHGKVEDSVLQKLDKDGNILDKAQNDDAHKISSADVLKILGTVVEYIPAVAEAIKLLSGGK